MQVFRPALAAAKEALTTAREAGHRATGGGHCGATGPLWWVLGCLWGPFGVLLGVPPNTDIGHIDPSRYIDMSTQWSIGPSMWALLGRLWGVKGSTGRAKGPLVGYRDHLGSIVGRTSYHLEGSQTDGQTDRRIVDRRS